MIKAIVRKRAGTCIKEEEEEEKKKKKKKRYTFIKITFSRNSRRTVL